MATMSMKLSLAADSDSPDADAENETGEKIVITGSRIPSVELSSATPITVVTREELARFGTSDLGSALAELSAIAATDTLQGNAGGNQQAGISSANLRDLGPSRTLTLVNGKRHVANTPGSAQVDLSTIPISLVERVEIITGGASAIYGSDAVTGVVNVILREDFEGFEVNMTGTRSLEGVGAGNANINILAGSSFGDGKGNVTFFAGREITAEVLSADIRQLNNFGTILNPNDTGEDDGIADRITVPFVGSELINRFGVINPFGPAAARYTFLPDGTPILQVNREGTNSFAFGNFPGGCDTCFFTERTENILPSAQKINVGSTFNYDISENIQAYGDFKYVRTDIKQQFQPSFRFGNISINVVDNPFLDPSLRQTLLDSGQTTVSMAKFFDELGNRAANNKRETFRFVGGFKGEFTLSQTEFAYDTYYINGKSNNSRQTLSSLIPGNLNAALDAVIDPATGEVACRSQVPGAQGPGYVDPATLNSGQCVPYNIFGFGAASQAARDYVSADVLRQDEIGQELYGGSITFDTDELFSLQGGPVGIALGYEYRQEFSSTVTDSLTQSGILTNAATPNEFGKFDVTEYFAEIKVPLIEGMAFAHELSIDAAFRNADYSHAGKANAWKVGLTFAPIDGLIFRGTFASSVRAPNISEAFSPQSPGFGRVSDPCDNDNISDDPDRAANCAALGIPAGFEANDNVSVNVISGGNPDLTSEDSDSTTFGIIWMPTFIEDFSISMDLYDIDLTDAITSVSAQTVADNCVDATGGPDVNFCGQIDRDPVTHDITLVRSGFINASAQKVRGVETNISYATNLQDIGLDLPGRFSSNLFISKLITLEVFEFQNRPDEINVEVGEVGDPRWQLRLSLNYRLDDLNVNWTSRYVDRSARFDVSPGGDTP
ncbi:MAG TPA: TonB-dependent receptor, partial [Aeromonadales bacterium]|nr:TonB-dependent receptor [Aeromonadales bacterium]